MIIIINEEINCNDIFKENDVQYHTLQTYCKREKKKSIKTHHKAKRLKYCFSIQLTEQREAR